MLQGVMQIGKALYEPDDVISNFLNELNPTRGKKQLNVLKFNFKLEEKELEIDVNEEIDGQTSQKYTFVGSADGPRAAQWYVSSISSNYHIGETFYNLSKLDFGKELNNKIESVLSTFYIDLGEEIQKKYRYILDIEKCGIIEKSIYEFFEEVKKEVDDEKRVGRALLDKIKGE